MIRLLFDGSVALERLDAERLTHGGVVLRGGLGELDGHLGDVGLAGQMSNFEEKQKLIDQNIVLARQSIIRAENRFEQIEKSNIENKEISLKMIGNIIKKRREVLTKLETINNQENQLIEIKDQSFIKKIINKVIHFLEKNKSMQKC